MKRELISAAAAALIGFAASQAKAAADPSMLLNKANVINYEEIEMAKTAKDKVNNNQGLTTFADILEADHKVNEDAVAALARQKGVKIEGTPASVDVKVKQLDNLTGGAFNEAFLRTEITDHEKAIALFERARSEAAADPEMELYIGETLPVMKAHLEMAKELQHHLKSSSENQANNS